MFERRHLFLLLATVLCCVSPLSAQTKKDGIVKEDVRVDKYGDPLPKYALLRLGTVRLTHSGRIREVFFSPDSLTVKAIGEDNIVRTWEVATGNEIASFALDGGHSVILSPNRKVLASVVREEIGFWDCATGKALTSLKLDSKSQIDKLAYAQDGKTVIGLQLKQKVVIWDIASSKKSGAVTLEMPTNAKQSTRDSWWMQYSEFSPDTSILAATGNDFKVGVQSVRGQSG